MSIRHRLRSVAPVWVALLLTAVGVGLAYLLKRPCSIQPWADNFQYSRLCYNDLQPLYGVRGIAQGLLPYVDVQVEYPVLTGVFMDLMGRLLRLLVSIGTVPEASDRSYFVVSAIFIAPFAFVVTLLLRKHVTSARLALWAAGTPLILYAFHNWDLLAVAGATLGLVALERGRVVRGAAAWAVGASAKLYPLFLFPAAFLDLWSRKMRRSAFSLAGVAIGVFALINLPWVIAARGEPRIRSNPNWQRLTQGVELRDPSTNGWFGIWTFHADRYPDFGTVWYWVAHHGRKLAPWAGWDPGQAGYRDFVSITSFVLFVVGSLALLYIGWRRRTEPLGYPVAAVGLGILSVFLLTSKVHSPQFALWLVPLLAMLTVPWRYILVYLAGDIGVFVSGFYYFTVMNSPAPAWMGVFEAMVLFRALGLALLTWQAARASRLFPLDHESELLAASPVSSSVSAPVSDSVSEGTRSAPIA